MIAVVLRRLCNNCDSAFSSIDVLLKKCFDLIMNLTEIAFIHQGLRYDKDGMVPREEFPASDLINAPQ